METRLTLHVQSHTITFKATFLFISGARCGPMVGHVGRVKASEQIRRSPFAFDPVDPQLEVRIDFFFVSTFTSWLESC